MLDCAICAAVWLLLLTAMVAVMLGIPDPEAAARRKRTQQHAGPN